MAHRRHRLAQRRKDVGLSQERLATAVGVDRSTVLRWERGETDPQPWHRRRLADALGISVEQLARLLSEAVEQRAARQSAPGESGPDDLVALESLRKADRQVGGSYLYAAVTGYLQRTVAPRVFGQVSDDGDGGQTFAAAAGLTEMAGWMAHDAGRDSLAEQHFHRALSLAGLGQDHQLVAHIYGSLSHLAYQTSRPTAGMTYASQGRSHLSNAEPNPGLTARLLALQAHGYAAERDDEACIQSLRDAELALGEGPGRSSSPWVNQFDGASLAAEAARCLARLDQPDAARQQAEQVVALRPRERIRSRAFAQLTLTTILVAQGRVDEACAMAGDVLAATRGLGSFLVVQHLERLRRSLGAHRAVPEVAAFLDVLTEELRERQWLAAWMPSSTSGSA